MSAEQSSRRPAEYGMEWGAYGQGSTTQTKAPHDARPHLPAFDLGPAPHASGPLGLRFDVSCLDVGVMFDVCLPEDQSALQKSGQQKSGQQKSGQQKSGQQKSGQQKSGQQKSGGDFADVVPLHGDWVALFLGDAHGQASSGAPGCAAGALFATADFERNASWTSGSYALTAPCLSSHQDPAQILKPAEPSPVRPGLACRLRFCVLVAGRSQHADRTNPVCVCGIGAAADPAGTGADRDSQREPSGAWSGG